MDRVLRPGGFLLVQDTIEMTNKLSPILRSLHWSINLHQEQFLVGTKGFWRPDGKYLLLWTWLPFFCVKWLLHFVFFYLKCNTKKYNILFTTKYRKWKWRKNVRNIKQRGIIAIMKISSSVSTYNTLSRLWLYLSLFKHACMHIIVN